MDVTRNILVASSCFFLMLSNSGNTNPISFFIAGGFDFSSLNNNALVEINEVVTNAYNSARQTSWQGFGGIGLSHTFETPTLPSSQFSLGLAGYFLQLGQVKGTEYPFINAGLFDSLAYHFHAKSTSLMLEAKAVYSKYRLKPYALAGIGLGWNSLYAYNEEPGNFSSSASPALPFSNYRKQTYAYELGAGLQYLLKEDSKRQISYLVAVGYQYFNLNQASLGFSAAQTTSDRIKINNFYTQGIVCSLTVSFA